VKPSYIICRYCYSIVWPNEIGLDISPYPTGSVEALETLKREAKQKLVCCGSSHFIRKVASKV